MKNNLQIREHAKANGVKFWEIAYEIGMNDSNFSRKLRFELPEKETTKILAIIDKIAAQHKAREDEIA